MAFLVGGANSAADTGYDIDNSLRFNYADVAFLANTTGSAGSDRIFTFSYWTKRSTIADSDGQGNNYVLNCSTGSFNDNNFMGMQLMSTDLSRLSTWYSDTDIRTAGVLRDPSAWYHIVLSVDTTQATDTNRVKIYVNGSIASLSQADYPDQNHDYDAVGTSGADFIIGAANNGSAYYDHLHGYLADFYFIDGTAYAASDFGETDEDSGIWKPKKASVTYGTNGFFLEFKETGTNQDSSGIGADTSGNDNHFAVTNLAATDQTTDTPTNNFATLRIAQAPANSTVVLTEGNCDFDYTQDGSNTRDGQNHCVSNIAMSSGKWYMECKVLESVEAVVGIVNMSRRAYDAEIQNWYGVYLADGRKVVQDYTGQSVNYSTYGSAFSTDDIVMVALDMDNKNIYWGKDGSWGDGSGNFDEASPHTAHAITTNFLTVDGDGENVVFSFFSNSSGASPRFQVNFGNPHFSISSGNADANGYGNFEFAVPTNYYALCTKNLAEYG